MLTKVCYINSKGNQLAQNKNKRRMVYSMESETKSRKNRVMLDLGDDLNKLVEAKARAKFLPVATYIRLALGEYVTKVDIEEKQEKRIK